MATARKSFEAILLDRSWVSAQDLDKARQRKKPGQELADVLVEMGALEPQRLARALAQEYRLPFQAHIDENSLDPKLVAKDSDQLRQEEPAAAAVERGRHGDRCDRRPGQLRAARRFAHPVRHADTGGGCAGGSDRRSDQPRLRPGVGHLGGRSDDRSRGRAARRGRQRARVGAARPARVRRLGADHQAGQRHPVAGGQGPRERYSRRSVRKRTGGALPRRRHAV